MESTSSSLTIVAAWEMAPRSPTTTTFRLMGSATAESPWSGPPVWAMALSCAATVAASPNFREKVRLNRALEGVSSLRRRSTPFLTSVARPCSITSRPLPTGRTTTVWAKACWSAWTTESTVT